jgi:hypothetical protein
LEQGFVFGFFFFGANFVLSRLWHNFLIFEFILKNHKKQNFPICFVTILQKFAKKEIIDLEDTIWTCFHLSMVLEFLKMYF